MQLCKLCALSKQVTIQHTVCCSAPTRVASQSWIGDVLKVFQMSAFEHDQSAEAQKGMIGDIRRAIEQGKTCFLMYTEPIHGSLYDLSNSSWCKGIGIRTPSSTSRLGLALTAR